jgi:tetratricopeptide (TPR) repeat protein/nucleoside phosphorylase
VAADRLFFYDTGKEIPGGVEGDLNVYKLRDDWKTTLEGMAAVAQFRDAEWFRDRPLSTEQREQRALVALRDALPEPWKVVDPELEIPAWQKIVASLRQRKLLAASGLKLTTKGRRAVEDLLIDHMGELPDTSPAGTFQPFRLHVAPIGSGSRVIENEEIWAFISRSMRKALGLEMEAAALGELAHRLRRERLDFIVMKGVMDFANRGRDDHFKEFAARASAECLLWFLREHVSTEPVAGFDDLLVPGTSPAPSGRASPSFLLNARHMVVPWHEGGRSEILADLEAWADDQPAVAVRLLHAEGGVGKTRLAIEWVRRRRERNDIAGFLRLNPDDRWLEKLCGLGPPVIIVIDYAESRADLIEILEGLAAYAATPGPHRWIRVLLLARGDGDWWVGLSRQSSTASVLLSIRAAMELRPIAATAAEREAVFVEAARKFAEMQGRPAVLQPPIALDDDRFERVLYLHMAALAAVEDITFGASSLMDAILDHEQRFWVREGTDRNAIAVDVPLARQLVAAATLRGGLATQDEARELCARLAGRPRSREDDALVSLLHDIYEDAGRTTYLPGLEPDLLGEEMVLRVASPPERTGDAWIERVLVAGDDAQALATAFAVLGRASATNAAAVRPWIARLIRGELPSRALLALRAAKTVGQRTAFSVLGDVLAEALEQHGTVAVALELQHEGIPYPTVSLRRVAEWWSRILLEHAPSSDHTSEMAMRARHWNERGLRLAGLGQREQSLAAIEKAVVLYRILVTRDPEAFEPDLATSLINQGAASSDLGRRQQALDAAREATALRRALARRNPERFQLVLARSLNTLGTILSEQGQHEQAIAIVREAVDLYRTLVVHTPDTVQPHLAHSLNNQGLIFGLLGQHEHALAATREAVDILRALATHNPDTFQPDLARSLNTLGNRWSALGQQKQALAATSESLKLYRRLATHNPDAFLPYLTGSLNDLGNRLHEQGEHEQAHAMVREAVDLRRILAARNPDAFQPDLAASLTNLGIALSALDQLEPALVATREAFDLYRTLATRNPEEFQPALANSLRNLGNRLGELGQHEQALAAAREAVELRRTLAARNPEAHQPHLARSLLSLGGILAGLDQRPPGLEAALEALDLIWPFVDRFPLAYRHLAEGILRLARSLHVDLGRELPPALLQREARLRDIAATEE